MRSRPRRRTSGVALVLLWAWIVISHAHQDSCHRLHSCPSDLGTYVCGDKGRCDPCPDNEFCFGRKPRAATPSPAQPTPPPGAQSQMVEVMRAIDGDTLELRTGEMVRLIGVDTPETKEPRKPVQYFGKEATAFTQRTVAGERVRPESDQQRHDQYGRTLASVSLDKGPARTRR
jgi:Staphylococcal nuclease homologue